VAATWFPANDHPSDKAAYTFQVTVPKGLEAVANGTLQDLRSSREWTTWTWKAGEPLASYLATATVGEFDVNAYRQGGIPYWDAIDPDLLSPVAQARTGNQLAISHRSEPSYKRLVRTISVPDGNVTTGQFIRLAEEVSGKNLDGLFNRWLVKPRKPKLFGGTGGRATTAATRPVQGSPRFFRGARVKKT